MWLQHQRPTAPSPSVPLCEGWTGMWDQLSGFTKIFPKYPLQKMNVQLLSQALKCCDWETASSSYTVCWRDNVHVFASVSYSFRIIWLLPPTGCPWILLEGFRRWGWVPGLRAEIHMRLGGGNQSEQSKFMHGEQFMRQVKAPCNKWGNLFF